MELPPLSLRSFKCPFLLGPWPRHESDIPVKEIKENIDIFSEFIFHNFNNSVFYCDFLLRIKKSGGDSSFFKKRLDNVENYRPVSILPNLSKIYEKYFKYFSNILNISIIYSQNGNVDSVKALLHNTVFF